MHIGDFRDARMCLSGYTYVRCRMHVCAFSRYERNSVGDFPKCSRQNVER